MYEQLPLGIPEGLLGDRYRDIPKLPELQPCEVHDVLAFGRCYIVKPVGMPRMPAVLGSLTSPMLPIGARDITMIVPGSVVLCWISDKYHAIILSVIASPMGSSQMGWPDSLVAMGHAGLFADSAHNQIITSKDTANGFLDFSSGAPIDSLSGDWGHINELGMGVFIGRLMAFMRAGELCKFEMHYADMLARLYAYNWQQYTAGSEDEAFDDEGEWTRIRSYSPFPWESAGVSKKGVEIFKRSPNSNPREAQENFGVEPYDQLQGSFVRYKEFEGFLGDLRRRFVMLPVQAQERRLYGRTEFDQAQHKGVFEEVLGIDGSYHMRSAKSIGFEKTVWIPVPEELYPRDNPKGDHDFTNAAGEGMDFSEYPTQDTPGQTVARLRDIQSHEINKRHSEPLNQRYKDWAFRDDVTSDEGKIETPGNFTNEILPLRPYSEFEKTITPSSELVAPTGERSAKYYPSKAFMGILPDGSILLRDGWGSELRMVGGNIEITCPGDVIQRPGRTQQTWAGKDVIIKSQQNLEMSSSLGNVRVKAEKNLEMLGGNDAGGGVLIEDRGLMNENRFNDPGDAAQIGGLVLKSSRSQIGLWGKTLYLSSTNGAIEINAHNGGGNIVMYASSIYGTLNSRFRMSITPKSEISGLQGIDNMAILDLDGSAFSYTGSSMSLGTNDVRIFGASENGSPFSTSLHIAGQIVSEKTIMGAVVTESEPVTQSQLAGDRSYAINNKIKLKKDTTEYIDYLVNRTGGNGNVNTYGLIGFSFRDSGSLDLGGMVIYEAEWQKRFRQAASKKADEKYDKVWVEKDVSANIDPDTLLPNPNRLTQPFPGKEAWEQADGAKYVQVDDQFYVSDATGGRPLPRGRKGSNYITAEIAPPSQDGKQPPFNGVENPTPEQEAFKDRYPINKA